MMDTRYVPLHTPSEFSSWRALASPRELVERAAALGMPGLALTDLGTLAGAAEFALEAERRGVQAILGCEFEVRARSGRSGTAARRRKRRGGPDRLVLLARDAAGWRNLMALSAGTPLQAAGRKRAVDWRTLKQHAGGLIALTAGPAGGANRALASGDAAGAERYLSTLAETYGREHVFAELMLPLSADEKRVNTALLALAGRLGLESVATAPTRYLDPEDHPAWALLRACAERKRAPSRPASRKTVEALSFQSPEAMAEHFRDCPRALENTLRVAERCRFRLKAAPTPIDFAHWLRFEQECGGEDAGRQLDDLISAGRKRQYHEHATMPQLEAGLRRERDVIEKMGLTAFFLFLGRMAEHCREERIPLGTGCGQMPASLICHCLGLTQVDPLRHGLLFDKFLHPERRDPPFLRIETGERTVEDLRGWVRSRQGCARTGHPVQWEQLGLREALKMVGRALGVHHQSLTALCRQMDSVDFGSRIAHRCTFNSSFEEALARYPVLRERTEDIDRLAALRLRPVVQSETLVLTPGPLEGTLPLYRSAGDAAPPLCQFERKILERMGWMTIHILPRPQLDRMAEVERILEERGQPMDWDLMDRDDPRIYEQLRKGNCEGLGLDEVPGIDRTLIRLELQNHEELMTVYALYRPISLPLLSSWRNMRQWPEESLYENEICRKYLRDTRGTLVFLEQAFGLMEELTGWPYARRNLMGRRLLMNPNDPAIRSEIREAALARGIDTDTLDQVLQLLVTCTKCTISKSHVAARVEELLRMVWLLVEHPDLRERLVES